MPGKENMSVEEVLAACRRQDGGATSDQPEAKSGGAEEGAPPAAAAEASGSPSAGAGSAKPVAEMSVAEIMAAARSKDAAASKPAPAQESTTTVGGSPGDTPAASAQAKAAKDMSVAEMLAAARREKAAPPSSTPAPSPGVAPVSPAAKKGPAAVKSRPASRAPAAAKPAGPKDTTSILAAARKPVKPGPMSKSEAAARAQPAAPVAPRKPRLEVPPQPAKSDYVRPAPIRQEPEPEHRRTFLASFAGVFLGSSMAVGFTSLAATHLVWLLGAARFMFPNVLTEPPTKFKVGFPSDYAAGQVETKYKAQFGVWIVRYEYEGQAEIYALKSVCTHLGCTPNWLEGEQKFKCPCHGSGFYKDGINFEGPAPRPLERYAIRVADDGQLEVDKSSKFQEELGQWSDPTCFVTV